MPGDSTSVRWGTVTGRVRQSNDRLRKARGTRSQAEIAESANREVQRRTGRPGNLTAKSISDLERGWYTWPAKPTREALCAVLSVDDPHDLGFVCRRTASPPREPSPTTPGLLDDLRGFLTGYGALVTGPPTSLTPLPHLRALVVQIHRAYQSARYAQTAAMLPTLLAGVDGHSAGPGPVQLVRTSAYVVTAKLLTKVGDAELAWIAADRAATAALDASSLSTQGQAAYQVACAVLRAGHADRAEQIALGAAERLHRHVRDDQPDLTSVAGALWLIAAIASARRTDHGAAVDHLAQAATLADRLGRDANHVFTAFGPTNVVLHRVSVATAAGDPVGVVRHAATVNIDAFPRALNGRRAQLHLDLAGAQAQCRHDPEAVFHLTQVERFAPELLRYYPTARAVVTDLLRREHRTRMPALRPLAARAGVL